MFLITSDVGCSHTSLDLLLFQKLHEAQLLERGLVAVQESPAGARNMLEFLGALLHPPLTPALLFR